jgi:hypothetical protein
MDSTNTLILVNLLINFLVVIDHIVIRLKRSRCCGADLELYKDSSPKNQNQDINKINFDDLIKEFRKVRKDLENDDDEDDIEKNKNNPSNKL